jgi:hypothetical protein
MHRTCNLAGRPLVSERSTEWIDRLAPDDPLLDPVEVEIPHAERVRPHRTRRAASPTAGHVPAAGTVSPRAEDTAPVVVE